ncbi:hypothetical protein ACIOMR_19645 [Pseudomonas sp. NPDC087814]|jgi:hypothetical protein|uniref:hypothetical protein n=1 Tax=unclassified Pseudomonas TaxID=196821 RepID=UPI000A063589|nr:MULTISPECIES: hypothetical protein [unclassified Pseudomonas]AUO21457.1 hypothetical protein C0058_05455 [Pseudomonas sp. NC02]MDQ0665930.1 hypothetical protein [Pseudomonas sp. W2I6]NWB10260.1 hypothetical protein [Pseudomonas sp. D5002]NWD64591.1 hypothetical protein [Pseudomonas sp. IPO3774]NWD86512.1 hypothetical protein [Pseudomonas sp. K5002]
MYQDTPYVFMPSASLDNGPQLRSIIQAGYRWIQINRDVCPIKTPVSLNKLDLTPAHGLIIEPAPGIEKVRIDSSGIGRNPNSPTDPSYAAFDYQGKVRPASYLVRAAGLNQTEIFVADATKYVAGDWIVISDASTNFASMPLPLDGPMEVRQVLRVLGGSLVINNALKTAHPNGAIVATCVPIRNVFIRGLEFTGNSAVGVHLHYAQHCTVQNITSVNWKGRALVLIDNGGNNNSVIDCYCTGTVPGGGPEQNAWGVVMEGQDSSRMINSGGELCGNGSAMNYCIDSVSVDARARRNNVNVGVYTQSLRSGFLRPRTDMPLILDRYESPENTECYISNMQSFS